MAEFTVSMNLATRPAIYMPGFDRPHLGIKKLEPVNVDVLGIYQVATDDDVDAYFVVTLPNGRCTYAGVEDIRFTDMGVEE